MQNNNNMVRWFFTLIIAFNYSLLGKSIEFFIIKKNPTQATFQSKLIVYMKGRNHSRFANFVGLKIEKLLANINRVNIHFQ